MSQNDLQEGGAVTSTDNPFMQLVLKWKAIVTEPTNFFSNLSAEGDMKEAMIFYGAIAVINSVLQMLFMLNKPLFALQACVITFISFMVLGFIFAGLTYWLSRRFGGDGSFNGTYCAWCYAAAPYVVAWIPLISFFAGLYSLYLLRMAVEHTHHLPQNRANAVVLIQVGIMIVLFAVSLMLTLSALIKPTAGG